MSLTTLPARAESLSSRVVHDLIERQPLLARTALAMLVLAIPVASRLRRVNIPDFLPCPFQAYRPRGRGRVGISLTQLYWQAKHSS